MDRARNKTRLAMSGLLFKPLMVTWVFILFSTSVRSEIFRNYKLF